MGQQIAQLGQVLQTARENLEVARSVYQGVDYIKNFDAQRFLHTAKAEFLARNSIIGETSGFANDLQRSGLRNGTLNPDLIARRAREAKLLLKCRDQIEALSERRIASLDSQCEQFGYNARAAASLAADTEVLLANPAMRLSLSNAPVTASASSGVLDARMMEADPALYGQLLRERAMARRGYDEATELETQLRAAGFSPGAAQQASAKAALLQNKQLADLNETQAQLPVSLAWNTRRRPRLRLAARCATRPSGLGSTRPSTAGSESGPSRPLLP
jgi:hypothetical protein